MNSKSEQPSEDWLEIHVEERPGVLLDSVSEICAIPKSAQEVIELTRSFDAPIQPIVDAVARDPALAAEVLRIANSPVFGQVGKVQSLHRAVVVLGMQELHNMAAAMAMLAAFPTTGKLSDELNRSSVVAATLARLMVQEIGNTSTSTAFICGLLSEIGTMICLLADREEYSSIWNESAGDAEKRFELEKKRYGTSSAQLGASMLSRNQLPDEVVSAVGVTVVTPADEMNDLKKATVFSRILAPILIRTAEEEEVSIPKQDILRLADRFGLDRIGPTRLNEICIEAAKAAGLGLRGEISLIEEEVESGEVVATSAVTIDRQEKHHDSPLLMSKTVRMDGNARSSSTGKWIVLGIAAALIAAAVIVFVVF